MFRSDSSCSSICAVPCLHSTTLHSLCLKQADSRRQLPIALQRVSVQALTWHVFDQVIAGGDVSCRLESTATNVKQSVTRASREFVQFRYVNQPEPELQGHSVTVKADQARTDSMCRDAEQTWPPALSKLMQVGLVLVLTNMGGWCGLVG